MPCSFVSSSSEKDPEKRSGTHLSSQFNPELASAATAEGLKYLQKRLKWSGTKIANILHLPPNTLNTWLKKGSVPITSSILHPDVQAVIHLLAIHRSLEGMFENPKDQQAWLSTLHPELNFIPEQAAGESIERLIYIRQYLDYV